MEDSKKGLKKFAVWTGLGVIVILLALAWFMPVILKMRTSGGEVPEIASLRSVCAAQEFFQRNTSVDQDKDGVGEYGLLNELAGIVPPRTKPGERGHPPFAPAFLSQLFTVKTPEGFALLYDRYCVQVFLPHKGKVVTDSPNIKGIGASMDADSINAQEKFWIAYAWPISGKNRSRCFVVNQDGEVYGCRNTAPDGSHIYEGKRAPSWNAAMSKAKLHEHNWAPIAVEDDAVDGQRWYPTGS